MEEDFHIDEQYIKQLSEKYKNVEHPLFMSELPSNIEDNKDLQALYSLMVNDETPISLAQKYKTVGNEYFQDGPKHYENAISSYTKGVQVLNDFLKNLKKETKMETRKKNEQNDHNWNENDATYPSCNLKLLKEEASHINSEMNNTKKQLTDKQNDLEKTAKQLLADLYSNIAIVHLKKKRYVKCVDNCKYALSHDSKKIKCIYNCIICFYYMELFSDAYKYVSTLDELLLKEECLKNSVNLQEYEKLKTKIVEKYENLQNKKKVEEIEKNNILEKDQNTFNKIKNILQKRNVTIVKNLYNNNATTPVLYVDADLYIHFTLYLIYFEMNCIETILNFPENRTILDYYDIIKKNKNNKYLFCYLEFPDDKFFLINNSYYMCDIINMVQLFSPVMAMHITENEKAHFLFQQRNNVIHLEDL